MPTYYADMGENGRPILFRTADGESVEEFVGGSWIPTLADGDVLDSLIPIGDELAQRCEEIIRDIAAEVQG
jgi:hypothetical protein